MVKALVKITYTGGIGDVLLIAPDGTRITPENSGMSSVVSNYIRIDNQKTIYYLLNKPQVGQWQYELINSTFIGLQIQSGKINGDPTLSFVSSQSGVIAINVSNTIVDIQMQWQCSEIDGTIDILYSTKPYDNLGIPLATEINVIDGNYTWSVGNKIPSGKYYITAVFRSNDSLPVFAFYNRAVVVTNATAPISPSSITATSSNGNINISWKASTESDVIGYKIYVNNGNRENIYNIGMFNNFTVEGLEVDKNYSIQMTSINNNDLESDKSAVINALLAKSIPPDLSVDWSPNQYTNNGLIIIKGSVELGSTAQIYINDGLGQENLTGSFDTYAALAEGENEIRVVAKKVNGDSIEETNTYWYDSSNPQLSVNNIFDGMVINSVYYVVTGNVEPNANLLINGKEVAETNGKFEYVLSLIPGMNNINISA